MHDAAQNGRTFFIMKYLISELGLLADVVDKAGRSPLQCAERRLASAWALEGVDEEAVSSEDDEGDGDIPDVYPEEEQRHVNKSEVDQLRCVIVYLKAVSAPSDTDSHRVKLDKRQD